MNFSGTKCDECGRIKGEGNHWHQIGVQKYAERVWIELGFIGAHSMPEEAKHYEVHDLCGEQCFYKHIGKLLKINPVKAPEDEAAL